VRKISQIGKATFIRKRIHFMFSILFLTQTYIKRNMKYFNQLSFSKQCFDDRAFNAQASCIGGLMFKPRQILHNFANRFPTSSYTLVAELLSLSLCRGVGHVIRTIIGVIQR